MTNATLTNGSHRSPAAPSEEPIGALVSRASQQLSQLVRDEIRLAQAEMTEKGKRFGIGGGLFGGAGTMAFVALQALAAAAIAALTLVLPLWASALIITGVLLVIAAVLAAAGRKQIGQATPPAPAQAIHGVKADMAEIKEKAKR
ncbi:phage holin family protein [Actinacidiphila soli]|uniref:phage holin family protein n=1 Tax=Actinacidiphila soli TaxID=2487275 RepID=UPI000FCA8CBC|nr:phage holin family protein [Actinacidiphila soli]